MSNYWVSWYDSLYGQWEWHGPWWVSGQRGEEDAVTLTICLAVQAESEDAAKRAVLLAHDNPPKDLEWRFVEEHPSNWTPFCERFPRAEWMVWPMTSQGNTWAIAGLPEGEK